MAWKDFKNNVSEKYNNAARSVKETWQGLNNPHPSIPTLFDDDQVRDNVANSILNIPQGIGSLGTDTVNFIPNMINIGIGARNLFYPKQKHHPGVPMWDNTKWGKQYIDTAHPASTAGGLLAGQFAGATLTGKAIQATPEVVRSGLSSAVKFQQRQAAANARRIANYKKLTPRMYEHKYGARAGVKAPSRVIYGSTVNDAADILDLADYFSKTQQAALAATPKPATSIPRAFYGVSKSFLSDLAAKGALGAAREDLLDVYRFGSLSPSPLERILHKRIGPGPLIFFDNQ